MDQTDKNISNATVVVFRQWKTGIKLVGHSSQIYIKKRQKFKC